MSWRGGGGGGGGYNNNNNSGGRRYFDRGGERGGFRGGAAGGGGAYGARQAESAPVVTREQQLAGLIVRIGDRPGGVVSRMVSDLVDVIRAETSVSSPHRAHVLQTLLACAAELPLKAPIYAAVVGLLNASDGAFGSAVVQAVAEKVTALLQQLAVAMPLVHQDVDDAHRIATALRRRLRLLCRFTAELANASVLSAPGMTDFLDLFLTQAHDALDYVDAHADSTADDDVLACDKALRRADFYASLACDTLPWCAATLRALKPLDTAEQLLNFQRFFERRLAQPLAALRAVADGARADGLCCERDALLVRWERLLAQQEGAWLLAAKQHSVHSDLSDKLRLGDVHDISNRIAVPARDADAATMYLPVLYEFELQSDAERAPTLQPGDVAVVREYVRDVLDSFNADHVGASKFLGAMPLPDGVNSDAIVVETVFTELLALPRAAFPLPFYTAVLGNLCQQPGSGVPKVLGRLALRLWKHAALLDVGVSDRFVRWLALHLSNFDYTWAWTKWAQTVALPDDDPQRLMVAEVILACVRLSYVDAIKEKLPEPLHAVLPPQSPAPALTYASDDAGLELHNAMHNKETLVSVARRVANLYGAAGLTEIADLGPTAAAVDGDHTAAAADAKAAVDDDGSEPLTPQAAERRLGAFFESLLKAGQQSFSHLLAVIERYEVLLKRLVHISGSSAQRTVVDVVTSVWRGAPMQQVLALDRLQTYNIIDAPAVIDWAFDAAHVQHFRHGFVRDILRNAMRWAVQAARTSVANNTAGAAMAVRNVESSLYLLIERAAAMHPLAAADSPVTLHFMRGIVIDIVRTHAADVTRPLRQRIEAIEGVEQLDLLDSAFAVGSAV
jgi:nuclear cap-binding protein subunit 1